jgi:hypothetical protein
MSVIIRKLYGVKPDLEARLRAQGIKDSNDLLLRCKSECDLNDLARTIGVERETLVQLVHRADLARIRGIGEAYMALLEAGGIASMKDLASSSPEALRARLTRINDEHRFVGRIPALAMVNGWVSKAQRLPRSMG